MLVTQIKYKRQNNTTCSSNSRPRASQPDALRQHCFVLSTDESQWIDR